MLVRQRLPDAVDEPVPAAPGDLVALLIDPDRRSEPTYQAAPRRRLSRDAQPGTSDLRPRVGLVPVDPGAAVLDRRPVPRRGPRAPAKPIARLEQQDRAAAQGGLPRGGDAGEAAPNDDHVLHQATAAGAATGTRRRATASTATAPSTPTNTGFSSIRSSDSSTRTSPTRSASRAAAATSAGGVPRARQQRRASQRADRGLDSRRAGRERHDRDVAEYLGPDPAEPDHERRHDRIGPGGDDQLNPKSGHPLGEH